MRSRRARSDFAYDKNSPVPIGVQPPAGHYSIRSADVV